MNSGRPPFDAIVLAGGRARRLGGVDKANIVIDGERLVDRVADAARNAGAEHVVIVGPESAAAPGAALVREDPPFSGPLAAVAAALPVVESPWTMVLSCDLEHPDIVCRRILAAFDTYVPLDSQAPGSGYEYGRPTGVVLRDAEGRPQWLSGMHRADALRARIDRLDGSLEGHALKILFPAADVNVSTVPSWETADIDLPDDLERANAQPKGAAP